MGTINIYPCVKVFDHNHCCNDPSFENICQFLMHGNCVLRKAEHEGTTYADRYFQLTLDVRNDVYMKHDQCKEYYQGAAFDRDIENSPEVLESLANEAEEEYLKKGLASKYKPPSINNGMDDLVIERIDSSTARITSKSNKDMDTIVKVFDPRHLLTDQ